MEQHNNGDGKVYMLAYCEMFTEAYLIENNSYKRKLGFIEDQSYLGTISVHFLVVLVTELCLWKSSF